MDGNHQRVIGRKDDAYINFFIVPVLFVLCLTLLTPCGPISYMYTL